MSGGGARDLLYKGFKGQKEGACASRKRRVTQSENSMIQWLTFSIQLMTALVFFEEAPVGGNKEPFGSSRITNSWSYGPVKRSQAPGPTDQSSALAFPLRRHGG